ncbi:MAG: hypothetical protein JO112_03540, partial [Planctomycetes bacterium]|nr:hypothetical protein [Planctomycetota bacterium]
MALNLRTGFLQIFLRAVAKQFRGQVRGRRIPASWEYPTHLELEQLELRDPAAVVFQPVPFFNGLNPLWDNWNAPAFSSFSPATNGQGSDQGGIGSLRIVSRESQLTSKLGSEPAGSAQAPLPGSSTFTVSHAATTETTPATTIGTSGLGSPLTSGVNLAPPGFSVPANTTLGGSGVGSPNKSSPSSSISSGGGGSSSFVPSLAGSNSAQVSPLVQTATSSTGPTKLTPPVGVGTANPQPGLA